VPRCVVGATSRVALVAISDAGVPAPEVEPWNW